MTFPDISEYRPLFIGTKMRSGHSFFAMKPDADKEVNGKGELVEMNTWHPGADTIFSSFV